VSADRCIGQVDQRDQHIVVIQVLHDVLDGAIILRQGNSEGCMYPADAEFHGGSGVGAEVLCSAARGGAGLGDHLARIAGGQAGTRQCS
jgi:hypothetical protein